MKQAGQSTSQVSQPPSPTSAHRNAHSQESPILKLEKTVSQMSMCKENISYKATEENVLEETTQGEQNCKNQSY